LLEHVLYQGRLKRSNARWKAFDKPNKKTAMQTSLFRDKSLLDNVVFIYRRDKFWYAPMHFHEGNMHEHAPKCFNDQDFLQFGGRSLRRSGLHGWLHAEGAAVPTGCSFLFAAPKPFVQ